MKSEGGAALPASAHRGMLTAGSSASGQELMPSDGEGSRPWWSSALSKLQGWLAPDSKKRLRDGHDAEEDSERRPAKARRDRADAASHEQAVVAARPAARPAAVESFGPELHRLDGADTASHEQAMA